MTHVLVFDSDCAACSRAARAVAEMGITGLEVRGLSDPAVVALLQEAGLERPNGPALVSGEGATARLATGWGMRRGLARLLGWRRAAHVVRLVSIEARAHATRSGSVSRRRVLGAGLAVAAGTVTSALLPEAASAAAPQTTTGLAPANEAETQRALGSAAVKTARTTWGPLQAAGVTSDGTTSVLVFEFTNQPGLALLVDNTAASGSRTALAVRQDTARAALEFFGADGTALGSVSLASGKVVATAPAAPSIHIPTAKIRCFLHCLGAHLKATCILTCHTCVTTPNPFSRIVACAHCIVCAGPEAIRCAQHCF
jgi:hypothetical protein